MKTLIVIDMQNDFIDAALGSEEAKAICPAVLAKINEYKNNGDEIIYTRDTHQSNYMETNEGKYLPVPHCIEGTDGWQIRDGLYVDGSKVIDKPTFGFNGWNEYSFEEIEIIGLCTDICVISNALILKATFPEIRISVDANCCAGVSVETHEAALKAMRCCQVEILNF